MKFGLTLVCPETMSRSLQKSAFLLVSPSVHLCHEGFLQSLFLSLSPHQLSIRASPHSGGVSYFVISHLQELGIDISGTLPFLIEQELVVAAVSTNSCRVEEEDTH